MKKIILTLVALFGATSVFAQTDVVATFQQGLGNAKAGNYTEAIAAYKTIEEQYPASMEGRDIAKFIGAAEQLQ